METGVHESEATEEDGSMPVTAQAIPYFGYKSYMFIKLKSALGTRNQHAKNLESGKKIKKRFFEPSIFLKSVRSEKYFNSIFFCMFVIFPNVLHAESLSMLGKFKKNDSVVSKTTEIQNKMNDDILGKETLLFGGIPSPVLPGIPSNSFGTSTQITLIGNPHGNYNRGCVLCLFMGQGTYGDLGRAAITGGDWRGGINAISPENAAVGLYEYADNKQPYLILDVSYYKSKGIVLKNALTNEQKALLKPGMYVVINSDDNSIPYDQKDFDKGNSLNSRFYQSYLSTTPYDDYNLTINIVGWKAPNSINAISGKIPHPTQSDYISGRDISFSLDTQNFNYTKPVVFIGGPNTVFGRNLFMSYIGTRDGSGVNENNSTSTVKTLVGEEIDLTASNMTKKNQFKYYGLTISTPLWTCAKGTNFCGATQDSAGEIINVELARALVAQCGNDCVPISGEGYWIHSDRGVQTVGTKDPIENWALNEFYGWVDSTNRARAITYLSKDKRNIVGISGASLHIAYQNSTKIDVGKVGDDWGSLVFNEQGNNNGGVSLCGATASADISCGLKVDYHNQAIVPNGLTVMGGNSLSLKSAQGGSADYPYIYASKPDTITVKTISGKKSTLSAGTIRAQSTLIIPFGQPESSNAPCTKGQIEMDTKYIYVCIAPNIWHRLHNGSEW